jgi:ribonuclease VapC
MDALESAGYAATAAPSLLEAHMVFVSRGGKAEHLQSFLNSIGIEALPFTGDHLQTARKAFDRYGKGRHPAALNFGDCMAYAAASLARLPLLFIGDDFTKTDISSALR